MENNNIGKITISDDVIATIASNATCEVEHVCSLSASIGSNITDLLGVKNFNKPIKIESSEEGCIIDIYVDIEYGAKIDKVGYDIQSSVKSAVEEMTDIHVLQVNVHVKGVKEIQKANK